MAAKVCLEHLNLIDDGFNLATEAVRRAVKQDSNISSRLLNCFDVVVTNSIVLIAVLFNFFLQSVLDKRSCMFYQVAPESDSTAEAKLDDGLSEIAARVGRTRSP